MFWSLTPRQLIWLRERHKQEREYHELLWAINTSTLANHSASPPKKAYKPYDFMPSKIREKAEKTEATPRKRWTRQGFAKDLVAMRMGMPNAFIVQKTTALVPTS
jgi:hypothetical protein